MARGVIADVHRREVESECLYVADDVVQVAAEHVPFALRTERFGHDPQVCQEFRCTLIAVRLIPTRRSNPLPHERDALAVELVGIAMPEIGRKVRKHLAIGGQDPVQQRRIPGDMGREREPTSELQEPRVEHIERGGVQDSQCLFGQLRRHIRVAVPVAAYPRPESQEGRDRDSGAGICLVDRLFQIAVNERDRLHDRRAEVDEPRVQLVHHGRLNCADLVAAPELCDSRAKPRAGSGELGRKRPAFVEVTQHPEDPRLLVDRGPAARFGWVSSQHKLDLRLTEHLLKLFGGDSAITQDQTASRIEPRRGLGAFSRSRRLSRRIRSLSSHRLTS